MVKYFAGFIIDITWDTICIHLKRRYRISSSKRPCALNWDFQKCGGGLLHKHYKEGKKIEIFQSLGMGNNTDMGDWTVKYGNWFQFIQTLI